LWICINKNNVSKKTFSNAAEMLSTSKCFCFAKKPEANIYMKEISIPNTDWDNLEFLLKFNIQNLQVPTNFITLTKTGCKERQNIFL